MSTPFAYRYNAPTAVLSTRCDVRHLAVIARYLYRTGRHPRSKSALLAEIVRSYHDLLYERGLIEPIYDTLEADYVLYRLGYRNLRPGGRNLSEFHRQGGRETLEEIEERGRKIDAWVDEAMAAIEKSESD